MENYFYHVLKEYQVLPIRFVVATYILNHIPSYTGELILDENIMPMTAALIKDIDSLWG